MSHSVSFSIDHSNSSIIVCNNIIERLEEIIQNSNFDQITKNELLEKKQKLENKISESIGEYTQSRAFEILREIDTLSKEVSNINWHKMIIQDLERNEEQSNVNYLEYIAKYGYLTTKAISKLKKANAIINKESLEKEIENIRHIIISEKELENFHDSVINYIDSLNILSDEIRYVLKNKILNLSTVQELSDTIAYLDSKIIEIKKIDDLSKNILKSLNKIEGFKQYKKPSLKFDKNNFNIVKTFYLVNKNNNKVQINIKGNMEISYKLGNYIGHACEKTTKKLINDLEINGYKISNFKITREIGISTQKQKAQALKIKDK
ncbi:hypothetical protein [[Mycoplasma] collis]|uniref:hypothetical protein n=1 Tax=[Mycoplasma] collis TaxID=2127 RepID=UPI00051CA151|nr:hypothetical protein [[Mycoplasma] collis]